MSEEDIRGLSDFELRYAVEEICCHRNITVYEKELLREITRRVRRADEEGNDHNRLIRLENKLQRVADALR